MLEISFQRDDRGRLAGLLARGHVGLDAHGKDVVCAAVSGILQAARLGLEQYAGALREVKQKPGELELQVHEDQRRLEGVRAILATAELAVEQIARQYPKHVHLKRVTLEAGIKLADQRRDDDV
jgi:uncharacterized protein